MQNDIVINSYENFILSVISDLNFYFFSTQYSRDIESKETENKFNDIFINELLGENLQGENTNNILIDEEFNKENYENYNNLSNRDSEKKTKLLSEKYSKIQNSDKNFIEFTKNKNNKKIKFENCEKKENLKNNFNTNKKNSFVVKTIIDHKIIDILIFLAIRHFSFNLQNTKSNIKKKFEVFQKDNISKSDKITDKDLKMMQINFFKEELEKSCATILRAITDFLYNCVLSLANYELVN
jgi:hypothetical protein